MTTLSRSIRRWRYIFIAPGVIWYVLFMVYPMLYVVYLSLHIYKGPTVEPLFVGARHFVTLFSDKDFLQAYVNTFIFVVIVVAVVTLLSICIAFLLSKIERFKVGFRAIYYLPSVVGVVAIGIIWQWVFVPRFGLLDNLIRALGLRPLRWLRDPKIALYCVSAVKIWMKLGFTTVVYLAGMLSIPQQYYDAADVDGAGTVRKFLHITIPLVMPITTLLVILNTIESLQVIGEIYMLTRGGPVGSTTTVGYLMYLTAFEFGRMGKASAVGLTLLVVILIITIFQRKFLETRIIEY